jgi:hypothetical protein
MVLIWSVDQMDKHTAKFISTVNWISHKLGEDLRYLEIDHKQRLIEIQKQLEQALQDLSNKQ